MRLILLASLLAFALPLSACGDDDDDGGLQPIPAAGEFTPADETPGVPPGSSYDVDGNEWLELAEPERLEAAEDYVADNPEVCDGAAPDAVLDFTDASIGVDYPLNAAIAELVAEGCAAARQSGEGSQAP